MSEDLCGLSVKDIDLNPPTPVDKLLIRDLFISHASLSSIATMNAKFHGKYVRFIFT